MNNSVDSVADNLTRNLHNTKCKYCMKYKDCKKPFKRSVKCLKMMSLNYAKCVNIGWKNRCWKHWLLLRNGVMCYKYIDSWGKKACFIFMGICSENKYSDDYGEKKSKYKNSIFLFQQPERRGFITTTPDFITLKI